MKKIIWSAIGILVFTLFSSGVAFTQGMMGFSSSSSDNTTIQSQRQEEQEGKNLLNGLSDKTVICPRLNDSDFEKIGEYFMGQSIGDTSRHIAMNKMMKRMMDEQGEEQAHIAMGKRLSGCDTSATLPLQEFGFTSMMNMVEGGGNSMMNFGLTPFDGFGWIFMILWWVLIIAGIVVLIKWLTAQSRGPRDDEKSPLEILKERYARGEIDKKEFEDKKKDLS